MQTYNSSAFPPLGPFNTNAGVVKNAHDTFDVYVNDEFIGKKVLLTQTEDVDDILDFVKTQNMQDVSAHLEGDHYILQSNAHEQLKQIIDTYLNNR